MKERYTKTKWVDGKTCVNAANLNKIESGIENLYRNAVGESQLHGKDGIDITKDTTTGNITIGLAAENDIIRSSAVGRIEVVESMPADPDPMCMYFVKDYDTGKFDLVFGGMNLLSTISTAEIPLAKLTGEVEVVDNGDGTFTVSYDGEETGVEIIVYLNNVPAEFEEDWVLVPGENTIEIHIRKDGYEEMIVECDPIVYTPTTPTPIVTYDEETYTVTVTGQGEIKFYVDEVEVELGQDGTYAFERGQEAATHVLTVTAQLENYAISEIARLEITVPSLPELGGTISVTENPQYSGTLYITYTGEEQLTEFLITGEGFELIESGGGEFLVPTRQIQLTGELGPHEFNITLRAEGYKTLIYAESFEWRRKLENPEISFTEQTVNEEEGVTISITNYTSYTVSIDGEPTNDNSLFIPKTYSEQSITVVANNIAEALYTDSGEQVTENYTLTAKEKTPSQAAEFSVQMDETKVYLSASGPGCQVFYQDPNTSEVLPIEFDRPGLGGEEYSIPAHTVYAKTLQSGEQYSETTTYYEEVLEVPAQQESVPAAFDITAGDEAYIIDFTGNVTSVYLDVNSIQVPYTVTRGNEDQSLTFRVTTKDALCLAKEVELPTIVPRIMTTPTPTISTNEVGDTVVVTATGEGAVTLSILGGEIVENPYTINKTAEQQTIIFMAVAKADGKLISSSVTQEVVVPPAITATPTITLSDDGLTVTATGDGMVALYVDGTMMVGPTYTFTKRNVATDYTVTAIAQETGKAISAPATLVVTIPALVVAPEPTFNWSNNTYTMSAFCEDHEVVLKLDGNIIENPYQVEQEDEEQTLTFTAYTVAGLGEDSNSAEIESEEVTVPPAENYGNDPDEPQATYAPEPTFVWDNVNYIMHGVCEGYTVVLLDENEEVLNTNPFQVQRTNEEQILIFKAFTRKNEEDYDSAIVTSDPVVVPALDSPAEPEGPTKVASFDGEIEVSEPTEEGVVTVSYTGDEPPVVNFSIILNGQEQVGTEIQLVEGENTIVVTISAPQYESKSEEFSIIWSEPQQPVPAPEPINTV